MKSSAARYAGTKNTPDCRKNRSSGERAAVLSPASDWKNG
jgi:hypothetical protein